MQTLGPRCESAVATNPLPISGRDMMHAGENGAANGEGTSENYGENSGRGHYFMCPRDHDSTGPGVDPLTQTIGHAGGSSSGSGALQRPGADVADPTPAPAHRTRSSTAATSTSTSSQARAAAQLDSASRGQELQPNPAGSSVAHDGSGTSTTAMAPPVALSSTSAPRPTTRLQ